MKKPLKKSLISIPFEEAHGGSGKRQVIFSSQDNVSSQFEAWTKGFLPVGEKYDWHSHINVDEFFIVLSGIGVVEYEDGTYFTYQEGDVMYNPSDLKHRIINEGDVESVFYFIRMNK